MVTGITGYAERQMNSGDCWLTHLRLVLVLLRAILAPIVVRPVFGRHCVQEYSGGEDLDMQQMNQSIAL